MQILGFLIGGLRGDEPYSVAAIEHFMISLDQDYRNGDAAAVEAGRLLGGWFADAAAAATA